MLKSFLLFCSLLMLGASPQQPPAAPDAAPAKIPAADAAMVNPTRPNPVLMAHAKKMYSYDCAMCHGANGDGKGDVGAGMTPPLKDWTDPAALKDMTDGELFYIIKNGRGQMTGEGDRVKADELWAMVTLTRSYAKK